MAKTTSQRAAEAVVIPDDEDEVVVTKGRAPDFEIKVRQPSYIGKDGKRRQSDRFTVVGLAWQQTDKHGQIFYGCKLTVPNLTFADNSFVLYPPYKREE